MSASWLIFAGVVVTAIGNYLAVRSTKAKVAEVHSLVNNQLDRQLIYSQQLAATLVDKGIPVPPQDEPPA